MSRGSKVGLIGRLQPITVHMRGYMDDGTPYKTEHTFHIDNCLQVIKLCDSYIKYEAVLYTDREVIVFNGDSFKVLRVDDMSVTEYSNTYLISYLIQDEINNGYDGADRFLSVDFVCRNILSPLTICVGMALDTIEVLFTGGRFDEKAYKCLTGYLASSTGYKIKDASKGKGIIRILEVEKEDANGEISN